MNENGLYMKVLFFLFLFFLITVVTILALHSPEDFCQDYWSAKYFLTGQQVYASVNCGTLTYNAHPPFSILLFVPFAFLPLAYATLIWALLSFLCYIIAGLLLLGKIGWFSYRNSLLFIIFSGIWPAFLANTVEHNIGQVFFLLFVAVFVLKNKYPYLIGVLLGIACLFRPWPAILLVGLLVNKEFKSGFSGIITILAGMIMSFFLFGKTAYIEYVGKIRSYEYANWVMHPLNISLTGAFAKIPIIEPGFRLSFSNTISLGEIVSYVFLLTTLFCVWRLNKKQRYARNGYTLALLLPVALLCFPLSWGWMLILFLIPFAMGILLLRKKPNLSRWWYVFLGIGGISILDPCDIFLTKINTTDYVTVRSYLHFVSYVAIFQTSGIILFVVAQIILLHKSQLQVKNINK